jgi:hypothetical protein
MKNFASLNNAVSHATEFSSDVFLFLFLFCPWMGSKVSITNGRRVLNVLVEAITNGRRVLNVLIEADERRN